MRAKKKPLPITQEEIQNRLDYINAEHKQMGNLHERMKWLVGCKESMREQVEKSNDVELFTLFQALGFAVLDLETELSYHKPANPAYTRRDPSGHPHLFTDHQKNPAISISSKPKRENKKP